MLELNYKRLFHQLILALSRVLDIDEARKLSHAQRTAVLSYLLASEFCPAEQIPVYYAALLHDIGGIGLFDHIVHHPSPAAQAANPAIRVHPVVGAQIVSNIPAMGPCVPIVLNHHERYDSHGYPLGKAVERVSLGAQLLRAADSFDLLIHHAPAAGSKKLSKAFARKSGKEVSPQIAAFVCRLIDETDTFSLLSNKEAIQARCLELNQTLAGFDLPQRMDVIGTLLEVFAQVIDTKHAYTAGHSQRVAKYSLHIGLEMDMPHDEISKLKWAALIHDLGKVAVPRSILDGGVGLSKEELEIVRQHPRFTIEILSCVSELDELGHLGAYHHERWDGRGYPLGLKGEEIPFHSRIICIADAFDSLTSNRSYHNAMGTKNALSRLGEASGSQFDPSIFPVAKSVLWSGIN